MQPKSAPSSKVQRRISGSLQPRSAVKFDQRLLLHYSKKKAGGRLVTIWERNITNAFKVVG
jgi:hypothetical protein